MDNELSLIRIPVPDETSIQEKNLDLDTYLSSSSTSLSAIDDEQKQQTADTPVTTIKKKRTKWHVYDTIAKFLLKNRFYLTALEFYTELLENGYDLPRLREYFSNPANFEGTSSTSITKQSPYIRNLSHYADDSVSLGGGGGGSGGGNGDYLLRTSSSQTFDSTSIDNVTRYSEDIDWNNGYSGSGPLTNPSGTGESRFNDERVAVLEFELRKARDTILELRQTLTYDSAEEQQQQNQKRSEERNGKYPIYSYSTNSSQPIIPSGLSARPFERRALNYLVNEYLLSNNYKVTSVTFGEENDTSDLEDWDSVGLNCSRPPDLNQLYRWYCRQLCIEDEKPKKVDFEMFINFDEHFQKDYENLKTTVQQMELNINEYSKRMKQIEDEKLNLNNDINSLQHEKKNLLIQLQLLQNRLTSDETLNENKMEETIQLNSTRDLPQTYRQAFKRQSLSYHINDDNKQDEDYEYEQKIFENILQELNTLSLDQKDLLDLIVRTIIKVNGNLDGSKKLDLVPLIIYTSILHPRNDDRDRLLKTLFNLYKKPSYNQRQIILHACLCFAKQSGPLRVHAELLPQCWENLNNKLDERRCLVAEVCGILIPHLPKDIRVSLIFSMLQQMLVEDKCEQVRCVCCKSLALVINEIDDDSRLSQCIELLDRCLSDTHDVVQSAKRYLLPSIAIWCLELNKICNILIEHYIVKLEAIVQVNQPSSSTDNQRFTQFIHLLTDLIVFIFASALKSMAIVNEQSETISAPRILPDASSSSEFYQLHTILSPNGEKLLNHYDQYAMNGEFPFTDQILTYLDDFLKRSFGIMTFVDITNGKLIHACSEFIKMISRYFGRNFWKLKIKPLYVTANLPTPQDDGQHKEARFVLYATGVLCSWTTEQERAELTQYIYDALLLVANQKLSINSLQAIYAEIGSDTNFQDILLNILRDSLTNTNSQVRLYILQLFNITISLVEHSIVSHKILPALITLASDEDLTVRTATIPVFGSIIIHCSQPEILERVYAQFQMFVSDTTFRDEHRVQSEFIKTFTQIAPHAESKFREDFILPFLALIASQNSQQQTERGPAKRLETATYLFEAYSALSCCFHSGQAILNSFLPGLYCLRVDFAQLRPDSVAVLDSIIKDLEHKLEQHRQDSSLLIGGTNLNAENIRGRMIKGLTTFRDSTEKLTYRFMKKK